MNQITKQSHNVLARVSIAVQHKHLIQRLHYCHQQLRRKLEVIDCNECKKRRIEIDLVRHDLDTAHQSLGDAGLVAAFFDDEGTYKLRLELLEMLINVFALLITDANNH